MMSKRSQLPALVLETNWTTVANDEPCEILNTWFIWKFLDDGLCQLFRFSQSCVEQLWPSNHATSWDWDIFCRFGTMQELTFPVIFTELRLYVFAAPRNQWRNYYIRGNVEDCSHLMDLMLDCFNHRFPGDKKVMMLKIWPIVYALLEFIHIARRNGSIVMCSIHIRSNLKNLSLQNCEHKAIHSQS